MAMLTPQEIEARRRVLQNEAESYVLAAGIDRPAVDPRTWCQDRQRIVVREIDLRGECDGLLRYRQGRFHLFYAADKFRWRFSLAHEVAHYLIDEHHQAIRSGTGVHKSLAGFIKDDTMEMEADWFASALLMPRQLFKPRCPDPNFKDIAKVRESFDVSLTSAALRTVFFTPIPAALVVTVGGLVSWCSLSEELARSGIYGVRRGSAPPASSKTAEVTKKPTGTGSTPIDGGKCWAANWFTSCRTNMPLWEEVLPVPRFNQVFTLLTDYNQ